ncbi:type II toxin-antitoxin system RelB/DinJ family antitoxin [Rugamonas sp. DEMB1]|jgi:DNA-damage-inducible protein J|uniref:type II toxin-antitoxin system RelB/DinJ family antitoxin n=1 Tax=Rugamonas sp. DEMB1 TaxID=3039386 RepID=UPI00244941E7|nr:type II toxin-antitoxin system RelB/DinJ family antitoxin [Rugamonas sp. DEMB1]WGG50073.1 type II toxin-antitoxin system RelB/DinJ family antitoxin [Rugamonas sp. DEMB1]
MASNDPIIRVRVDAHTKKVATETLDAMGLTVPDVIRILLRRVAEEKCLPFDVQVPNKSSRKALAKIAAGEVKTAATIADLMTDLNADD